MNKQTIKVSTSIIIGLILSFNVGLYAWSGLQAETGDKLSLSKWNELASNVWGKNGYASYYTAGNVGIGTSAPVSRLHVNDGFLYINNNSTSVQPAAHIQGTDSTNSWIQVVNKATGNRGGITIDGGPISGGVFFGSFNYVPIGFGINNAEAMRIAVNGNVGIGTASPQAKLDIDGSALLGHENIVTDFGAALKSGFFSDTGGDIVGEVPDNTHGWTHLINSRHANRSNNYKLQIASTFSVNDRMFFRKTVGASTASDNTPWIEFATRGSNTFVGDQFFQGNLRLTRGVADEGPTIELHNTKKTGATYNYWRIFNMTGVYGNKLSFWGYPADGVTGGRSHERFSIYDSGNARLAGTLTQSSDQRYKKDITNISNSLQKLQNINGVYYKRKDETKSKDTQIGFIAQNLEKEFPELVSTDTNGYKSVQYSNMTAVLVEAIKEQQIQIQNLENELKKIKENK